MSSNSIMRNILAGEKGVKLFSISPLGPNFAEKEWDKWLNYIPEFQQEKIKYLSNKKVGELTSDEIEELHIFQKELKMQSILKIYGEEEMNRRDALEFMDYTSQEQLDSLIRRKLTDEEYQLAIEKTNQLLGDLSYNELLEYCREQKKKFEALSMVDSFVLRRVSNVVNIISEKKTSNAIAYEIEKNEIMRKLSLENASKMFLK